MLRKVKLTLTSETRGKYILSGYNHTQHRLKTKYYVPLYKLKVNGTDETGKPAAERVYWVVRFGVKEEPEGNPIVVGVQAGTYTIKKWKSAYLSGREGVVAGAWVIKGTYYIHDGENKSQEGWGAIGCIEIVGENGDGGDKFANFNYLLRILTGTQKSGHDAYNEIANHALLTLTVLPADTPKLEPVPSPKPKK